MPYPLPGCDDEIGSTEGRLCSVCGIQRYHHMCAIGFARMNNIPEDGFQVCHVMYRLNHFIGMLDCLLQFYSKRSDADSCPIDMYDSTNCFHAN